MNFTRYFSKRNAFLSFVFLLVVLFKLINLYFQSSSDSLQSVEILPASDSRVKCLPNEPLGEHAIPKKLLNDANTWYYAHGLKPVERSVPVVNSSQIGKGDGSPSDLPKSSTIELVGKHFYRLTNFCISPEKYGGLILYGQVNNTRSEIEICNEFGCKPWKTSNRTAPPPSDAVWIRSSTAIIKCFTDSNPWHVLQHLLSLNQLLNDPTTDLSNGSVHLHPTFSDIRVKTIGYRAGRINPFQEKYFNLWPLLPAILPNRTKITQYNVLSDLTTYPHTVPKLCYRLGYLDGPLVSLKDTSLVPTRRFGAVNQATNERFRSNVVALVGAEALSSGRCVEGATEPKAPVLGFVLRKERRVLCNAAALVRSALRSGFDVKIIRFEEMSIENQVRAVRSVDVLAGMHGAGLTNIFWARPGSVLLEIYPANGPVRKFGVDIFPQTNYGALALSSESTHIATGSRNFNASMRFREHDLVVDVMEFEKMLNATLDVLNSRPSCQVR